MGKIVRVVCCTMYLGLDVRMRKKISKESRSVPEEDSPLQGVGRSIAASDRLPRNLGYWYDAQDFRG